MNLTPRISILLISTALCCVSATAAPKTTVLKGACMFDGHRIVTPGFVVVTGNQITGVGVSAAIPHDAEVLDFHDETHSPVFTDAHTHVSMDMTGNWNQAQLDSLQRTVRDLGSSDFIDVSLRNAIRATMIAGPRMLVCVNAIGAIGGVRSHADAHTYGVTGAKRAGLWST